MRMRLGSRRRVAAPRPQRLGARRALVRLEVELRIARVVIRDGSQRARSVRRVEQTREEDACSIGRTGVSSSRREDAFSRSFRLFGRRVLEHGIARAGRGDAPIGSAGPSRPRRSVADSAHAPAAPPTRTSRTTPRESAPRGRPWRSVRPSLSAALKKFPGNHVGEMLERSARREGIPRPATAPRPDARTCAHRRTRSPSRSEWARGKRSFVARLGMPRASLVGDASNTRLDAALCSRSARAKMERVDSLATSFAVCTQIISLKKN